MSEQIEIQTGIGMRSRNRAGVLGAVAALAFLIDLSSSCHAAVTLPRIFSDHAVLQRAEHVPIWGSAAPDEKIAVKIANASAEATANAQGAWIAYLNLQAEGDGPFELVVQGSNKVVFSDVLIGEVWLCSGQSNMRFHLSRATDGIMEAAQVSDTKLRFLSVGLKVSDKAEKDIRDRWTGCDPKTAGDFSAVGYYFGKELRKNKDTPVGLISASWAATCIEEWMSPQALASDPDFQPILDRWKKRLEEYPAKKEEFEKKKDELLAAWEKEAAKAKADGKPEPLKPGPGPGPGSLGTPSGVFNGEIMPIAPYAIRGVVWYQGEQNSGRGFQYRKLLPAMILDWRALWKQSDLPFLIVQLPNFGKVKPDPTFSLWAELREAQAMALALPSTALAVTIDVGEDADVHPKDKKTVGIRLARIAAKDIYKLPLAEQVHGPTFKAVKMEGDTARVEFDYAKGLKTKDGKPLTDFAIAGSDHKFVWAAAEIDGETVVVRSATIKNPVAVRYNWADAPHGNLVNADNLPAAPFRTDDFKTASLNNR